MLRKRSLATSNTARRIGFTFFCPYACSIEEQTKHLDARDEDTYEVKQKFFPQVRTGPSFFICSLAQRRGASHLVAGAPMPSACMAVNHAVCAAFHTPPVVLCVQRGPCAGSQRIHRPPRRYASCAEQPQPATPILCLDT